MDLYGAIAETNNLQRLERRLNHVTELMGPGLKLGLVSYPVLLWSLYVMCRLSRQCLTMVRQSMSWCGEHCATGGCLAGIYNDVSFIRDSYLRIVQELIPQLPLPGIIKRKLTDNLDDWDDLAEDCYIGMDENVRSLIGQVGDALRNHSYASV